MEVNRSSSVSRASWHRAVAAALIVAVVIVAGYLRLVRLGESPFHIDELYHHYAAISLKESGQPELPSGELYERGVLYSELVSYTQKFVSDPEAAARLPSAVFGILGVAILALGGWLIAGPWAALFAALLLTFYPEHLFLSRFARFYTYQLVLGIGALLAGWGALRHVEDSDLPTRGACKKAWLWLLVSLGLLVAAAEVQPTTLSVAVGFLTALGVAALIQYHKHGPSSWTRNVPLQAFAVFAAAGLVFVLLQPERVSYWLFMIDFVPAWAREQPQPLLAYYYDLDGAFPAVAALSPAIFLAVVKRSQWSALYLALWFAIPILIHSFLLEWKEPRYALLAVPGLFLATGICITDTFDGLRRLVEGRLTHWIRSRAAAVLSLAAVCVAVSVAFVSQPAVKNVAEFRHREINTDWRGMRNVLESVANFAELPLGSTTPLEPEFYLGRLDFLVNPSYLEVVEPARATAITRPIGSADFYVGVPILTNPRDIRARFPDSDSILVATSRDYWNSDWTMNSKLRSLLKREAKDLCGDRCGSGMLFLWTP